MKIGQLMNILTQYFLLHKFFMAELRRLIITDDRLKDSSCRDNNIALTAAEAHYISRVMRYKYGDQLHIVDGKGNLWLSQILSANIIKLLSNFEQPICFEPPVKPLTGLAVVVPKQGFDDVLRMSCELGIDLLQPLYSDHSVLKDINEGRFMRWENIINESIEQSERLWKPELKSCIHFHDWIKNYRSNNDIAICTTRLKNSIPFEEFLLNLSQEISSLWTLIGPEGGWSMPEIYLANENGYKNVKLGDSILRTSTASISATQSMMSWRRSMI